MFKLSNKFLSCDVYKNFINEKHFLYQLAEVFDWSILARPLWEPNKNEVDRGGRRAYSPELMLKMIFLSFLFDRSDRETEFFCSDSLSAKQFLGLPINEKAPDHSTVSRFRNRVLLKHGVTFFEKMFKDMLEEAIEKGVVLGKVYALDATHVESNVNGKKDSHEVKEYEAKSKDPDASWGTKKLESKLTKDGKKVMVQKNFFGYKVHELCETNFGLATHLYASTGKLADIDGGDWLVHRILTKKEREQIDVLLADKGYSCPVWINLLEKHADIMTAFALSENMTKKGTNKKKWLAYEQDEGRTAFYKSRTTIERVFGDLKENHRLNRAKYKGLKKMHLQAFLSSAAHNAKIIVRELTGIRFKPI